MTTKPRPAAKSLRRTLATAVLRAVMCTAAGIGSYATVSYLVPVPMTMVPPESPESAAPTAAEVLLQEHDCWTDEVPADMEGFLPPSVVLTFGNTEPTWSDDPVVVGWAIDTVFGERPKASSKITVHGFCRDPWKSPEEILAGGVR